MSVAEWTARRKAEKQWEHSLHRYVLIGRKADDLLAVWDAARGRRISRWLRPERAERACADVEHSWRVGGSVTGWIHKVADE